MKLHTFVLALVGTLLIAGLSSLHAQEATKMSAADRQHLKSVREQVLNANPDLKAEQASLKAEGKGLKGGGGTPEAKAAFMQHLQDHMAKMKAAMIKVDPTVAPLIDQAEANMKAKMAAHAGAM